MFNRSVGALVALRSRARPPARLLVERRAQPRDRPPALPWAADRIFAVPDGADAQPADAAASPLADTMTAQMRGRLETALSSLQPGQKRALELAYFDGMSHSEIAAAMGEPLGTVKTRIRQGLLRMRRDPDAVYGEGALLVSCAERKGPVAPLRLRPAGAGGGRAAARARLRGGRSALRRRAGRRANDRGPHGAGGASGDAVSGSQGQDDGLDRAAAQRSMDSRGSRRLSSPHRSPRSRSSFSRDARHQRPARRARGRARSLDERHRPATAGGRAASSGTRPTARGTSISPT